MKLNRISSNATEDSQLAVPENATVITPGSQIPLETTNENISMTIQSINSAHPLPVAVHLIKVNPQL